MDDDPARGPSSARPHGQNPRMAARDLDDGGVGGRDRQDMIPWNPHLLNEGHRRRTVPFDHGQVWNPDARKFESEERAQKRKDEAAAAAADAAARATEKLEEERRCDGCRLIAYESLQRLVEEHCVCKQCATHQCVAFAYEFAAWRDA